METQLKPTIAILDTCELINEGISKYLDNISGVSEEYESNIEAHSMLTIAIRYVESIIELAQSDLVLLPAVNVLARSVFECSLSIIWLISPREVFDREGRWLGRLEAEENLYKKLIDFFEQINYKDQNLELLYHQVQTFRSGVEKLINKKQYHKVTVPNFRAMLKSIGIERFYSDYIVLSQFTHSTAFSLGYYKRGYGTMKEYGEFIEPKYWKPILEISWNAFESAAEIFYSSVINKESPFSKDFKRRIRVSISNIT